MTQLYTQQLEQIISEMDTALSSGQAHITNAEYEVWLEFLKRVHPESQLLSRSVTKALVSPDTNAHTANKNSVPTLRQYSDIREIMMLAETKEYPTWFIQPSFVGLALTLTYENGDLQSITYTDSGNLQQLEIREVAGIPTRVADYTGTIQGVLYMSKEIYKTTGAEDRETAQVAAFQTYLSENTKDLKFNALDIDSTGGFLEKMRLLRLYGFNTPEYVLFPTSRLSTISSSKLETFFNSYIVKAESNGYMIDGLVIISDTPLIEPNTEISSTHIIFKPDPDST